MSNSNNSNDNSNDNNSDNALNDDFDAMFNENDDVFDGLNDPDLQIFNRLPFFSADKSYLLEVDCVKFTKSTQNNNRFYHLEFTILESNDEDLPVGIQARNTITVSAVKKYKNYGIAAYKQFLSAVTGLGLKDPRLPVTFWKELGISTIKEGKINGKKVRLNTVANQNNEKFPFHNYSHAGK